MKCIIVDDERIAREGLAEYVNKTPFLELKGMCRNAIEASEKVSGEKIDLMFLDINMPELSGMEFAKMLEKPPLIVFTTAYPDYALEGFEVNAVDYLVKPIPYERFLRASNKAFRLYKAINQPPVKDEKEDYIYVKVDKKLYKIEFNEINYVESMKDYIRIHTRDGGKYMTLLNLKTIEQILPHDRFIKVHKSYLVAISAIRVIYGNMIELPNIKIPIGREYKNNVMEGIVKDKFLKK